MESVIWGVPAVAFSLDTPEHNLGAIDFSTAAQFAGVIVKTVLQNGVDPTALFNVNVPYLPFSEVKGIKITRQGLRVYHDKLERRLDPRGLPYYWNIGGFPTGIPEDGSDVGALAEGFVSVTPVQLDLTDYAGMKVLADWQWGIEKEPAMINPQPLFMHGLYL